MIDNTELESAYDTALAEFTAKAGSGASESRYFFWAGATFGVQLTARLHDESYKVAEMPEDAAGRL